MTHPDIEQLCDYSGLPTWMCDHCPPTDPTTLRLTLPPHVGPSLANHAPTTPNPKIAEHARRLLGVDKAPVHMRAPKNLHAYMAQLAWPIANQQRRELTKTNRDGTVTRVNVNHPSTHPPLITQLHQAAHQATQSDEGGRAGYASKPTARIDALDGLARIDAEATRWFKRLAVDEPRDLIHVLRRVNGLAAGLKQTVHRPKHGCCVFHELERAARSWWIQARVLTGWDSEAWKPDNTCPLCGARGTLRVKLIGETAMCTGCLEVWDETTIALLADHIRAESEAEKFRPHHAPCWCVWPRDEQFGRITVCPDCGSRYCVKVQDMVVTRLPRRRA